MGNVILDVESILYFANRAKVIIGEKWICKKILEWERKPKPKKYWKNTPSTYLPQHQLIYWFIEFEKWQEGGKSTGIYQLSAIVIKLAEFGRALESVQAQSNFSKLLFRLKSHKEFLAAAFEVEVAASYVREGWNIEFIEEKDIKTPDLRATKDEVSVWVECKRKDEQSERDRLISTAWDELEQILLDRIRPRKLNYCIGVKAYENPSRADVEYVSRRVIETIDSIESKPIIETGKPVRICDCERHIEVVICRISASDELLDQVRTDYLEMDDYDRAILHLEAINMGDDLIQVRNPSFIAMGTVIPPDHITGVVHAFHSAAKQIPSNGPGIVWIRMPDGTVGDRAIGSEQRIQQLLEKEMQGECNQRVNAVAIRCWTFRETPFGLTYVPTTMQVWHTNPRIPLT